MINIVIPMAGRGSRFAVAGYADPKPLIPIHGRAMIEIVIANLRPRGDHRFIFICQREHHDRYDLGTLLPRWGGAQSEIVLLDGVTQGAACTVLTAETLIDGDTPLMIANSDQYTDIEIDDYLASMNIRGLDGLIMTMKANDPKWSFAGTDRDGLVTRVVEKEVISQDATVGIYNFARGGDFVVAAQRMITADERTNGEFYVAPVYNQLIAAGKQIGIFDIGAEGDGMYGLGIPSDLEGFLALPLSHEAASRAGAPPA